MKFENSFIEQAEYLPKTDFISLSSVHPREKEIQKKLTQSGAKLIIGPRGCGKTTLILKAYYNLLDNNKALPIYVNFKSSLKLEPNYKKKANGSYLFNLWMYLKIYEGLFNFFEESEIDQSLSLSLSKLKCKTLINNLEIGNLDSINQDEKLLSYYDLESDINTTISYLNLTRAVIYFDDAAHAFSKEQQKDFFELFRKIKSRNISPKAAIYPGVTNFSPSFNPGHDAELINVWLDPESDTYFDFMFGLLKKRIPDSIINELIENESLLSILCYSAFGIPRHLLNMARNLYDEENGIVTSKLNRKQVFNQLKISFESTMNVFDSLQYKLPIYKMHVSFGKDAFETIIQLIKEYNRNKTIVRKSIVIAFKKNVHPDLSIIFGFFQYAGLLRYKGDLNKGVKGTFEQYIVNVAGLINKNAILTTRSINVESLAISLKNRNAHEFTRTQSQNFLENDYIVKLTLPPCQNCGQERVNENARFCSNCGAKLSESSVYKTLIKDDISKLQLTSKRIASIKTESSIDTIKDILFDIGHKELRSVKGIGEFWGQKIYYLAEEYIS